MSVSEIFPERSGAIPCIPVRALLLLSFVLEKEKAGLERSVHLLLQRPFLPPLQRKDLSAKGIGRE